MDKRQIRTKKDMMARMQRFEVSLNDTVKLLTSRAPLDSTAIYPITRSPTNTMRPVKDKTYQDHTFALRIPLELDYDDLCSPQDGTPFLIVFACTCLTKTHISSHPYSIWESLIWHIFTYPLPSSIWQASRI